MMIFLRFVICKSSLRASSHVSISLTSDLSYRYRHHRPHLPNNFSAQSHVLMAMHIRLIPHRPSSHIVSHQAPRRKKLQISQAQANIISLSVDQHSMGPQWDCLYLLTQAFLLAYGLRCLSARRSSILFLSLISISTLLFEKHTTRTFLAYKQ